MAGDPGPRPDEVMDAVTCPIHCLWAGTTRSTPLDGTGGRYFQGLAAEGRVSLTLVDAGHVPHDDVPDEANADSGGAKVYLGLPVFLAGWRAAIWSRV